MIPLFLGITALNLLCLTAAAALGYAGIYHPHLKQYHQLLGVVAAITCCGVHCIVFTYFMATAKWVQHAITVKQLDPALAAPTRSFKAQAFPAALSSIATVFLTAFVGAATLSYEFRGLWHHALALLALAVNLTAAFIEYRAILRNGALIDGLLSRISPEP
jgi:hypothetical protein